jgi:hypothetical protein
LSHGNGEYVAKVVSAILVASIQTELDRSCKNNGFPPAISQSIVEHDARGGLDFGKAGSRLDRRRAHGIEN